jgi:hypothetical protein
VQLTTHHAIRNTPHATRRLSLFAQHASHVARLTQDVPRTTPLAAHHTPTPLAHLFPILIIINVCFGRHTAIQQRRMKSKEEYRNNRGMTILPQPFGTMMFQRLVSKGYIDPLVHIPQLWGGAGVILSSNDSACDIFTVDEIFYHENPFVICDPDDQLCFTHSPPFWSLPSETVFVRVFCNGIDGFDKMCAEVGPRRKGPMLDGSKLFDDVERMIIMETPDSCIVTFPSLRGLPKETALALQNRQDAKWMVGVNPFMSLFEER